MRAWVVVLRVAAAGVRLQAFCRGGGVVPMVRVCVLLAGALAVAVEDLLVGGLCLEFGVVLLLGRVGVRLEQHSHHRLRRLLLSGMVQRQLLSLVLLQVQGRVRHAHAELDRAGARHRKDVHQTRWRRRRGGQRRWHRRRPRLGARRRRLRRRRRRLAAQRIRAGRLHAATRAR